MNLFFFFIFSAESIAYFHALFRRNLSLLILISFNLLEEKNLLQSPCFPGNIFFFQTKTVFHSLVCNMVRFLKFHRFQSFQVQKNGKVKKTKLNMFTTLQIIVIAMLATKFIIAIAMLALFQFSHYIYRDRRTFRYIQYRYRHDSLNNTDLAT